MWAEQESKELLRILVDVGTSKSFFLSFEGARKSYLDQIVLYYHMNLRQIKILSLWEQHPSRGLFEL